MALGRFSTEVISFMQDPVQATGSKKGFKCALFVSETVKSILHWYITGYEDLIRWYKQKFTWPKKM